MMDSRRTMASLEDEEESVRIAVKALGDMRNGTLRADGASFGTIDGLLLN